jgi:hypothetical protein
MTLGWPLRNICVTHRHGYVLSSFPLVVKELTTIPEYPSSPRYPHAMALKQLTSILFTKLKDGLKNRFNLISYKRMTTIYRHVLQQQGETLFLANSYVKLTSKYSSVWSTTYLLCLMNVCFNRQSTLLMVPTVPLFIQTSSFICMEWTSMQELLKRNEYSWSGPLTSRFSK